MDNVIILGQQRPTTSTVKMKQPISWHLHSNTHEFPSLTRNDQPSDKTITEIHIIHRKVKTKQKSEHRACRHKHKNTKVIAWCAQDRENAHHTSNDLHINKNSKCKTLCHPTCNQPTLSHNHDQPHSKYRPQTCVVIDREAIRLDKETCGSQTLGNATSISSVRKYIYLGPTSAPGNQKCKGHEKQPYNVEDGDLVYKEWRAKHMPRVKTLYAR